MLTAELAERLGVSTFGAAGAILLPHRIRPITGRSVFGRVLTVRCDPADNLALHVAVASGRPGDVLVADCTEVPDRGYWGEILTLGAQSSGLAGLVSTGGVRDVDAIEALGFCTFATCISAVGTTKSSGGSVGAPIMIDGVTVTTGAWIIGDQDGVAVISDDELEAVVQGAVERARDEEALMDKVRSGQTTTDLLRLPVDHVKVHL